ncbi:MAG: hypothetical protein Kow0076_2280 [Francisella sp.]
MRKIFAVLIFFPVLSIARMSQDDIDKLYTRPIVLDGKHYTFDIELPVDSIDGYRWFLSAPDYDFVDDEKYIHSSANVEKSKWGGMDHFKLKLTKKFKKVPFKVVLHFECLRPFESNPKVIKKDITVLSIPD